MWAIKTPKGRLVTSSANDAKGKVKQITEKTAWIIINFENLIIKESPFDYCLINLLFFYLDNFGCNATVFYFKHADGNR